MEKTIDLEWVLTEDETGATRILHICPNGKNRAGLWPIHTEKNCCVVCDKKVPDHVKVYV